MMNLEADEFCMPAGFIFEPTGTELLSILEAKILEPTSYWFVPECKGLYDEEPWSIFGEPSDDNRRLKTKNHYYVFTKLKKSSKSRFGRRVGGHNGGGTWKGNNVKDVKNDRGVVVGTVRNFTFVPTKKAAAAAAAAGRWIMDEFSIPKMSKDYVVCEIKSIMKARGENLMAEAAPSWPSPPQQYLQQVQYYDHRPDVYDDGNHMLSDTFNHGDQMISSIPSSSSSQPLTHPVTDLCNGDDDIDQLLSSFSTKYLEYLQQADQYDYIAYDVDHMLSDILLPTHEDINGAEGHESVDYDDHRVSSISLPPSTLPAATLFNDEQIMIPSLPRQQGQNDDHMPAYAEGDKAYEHMTQEPLECSTTSQQQAGAPSSSPLDELLLSFPSTQQVQQDHMEYDLDELLFSDVPPAADIRGHDQCQLPLEPSFQPVPHDEKKSSHWDLEAFSALVASQDVNSLVPCYFTDIVSSPTSVHGVNFDDLWA